MSHTQVIPWSKVYIALLRQLESKTHRNTNKPCRLAISAHRSLTVATVPSQHTTHGPAEFVSGRAGRRPWLGAAFLWLSPSFPLNFNKIPRWQFRNISSLPHTPVTIVVQYKHALGSFLYILNRRLLGFSHLCECFAYTNSVWPRRGGMGTISPK